MAPAGLSGLCLVVLRRPAALLRRGAKECLVALMKLLLEKLKFELEPVDIVTLCLRQRLRQLDETIVKTIVLRLKQLGDLTESFDIGFG
jgi:hypothetical protein